MECREQIVFAMVNSFIDAAHVNTDLKKAFGQLIAADSRKSDRGKQGYSGGSVMSRCGEVGTDQSQGYISESIRR